MNVFQDKIVLITGASSGIGRETALQLAKQGARLALASRKRDTLEELAREIRKHSEPLVVPTDVTAAEQCRHMVETTVNHFGKLDALINSAGLSMRGWFEDSQIPALEKVMQVNFFGTMYATHYAIPHIKESRGSLVAISSLTGKRGIPSYAMYGATKFAIQGLYEAIRIELAAAGVHVGIVSPGFVATPLRDNVLKPDGTVWEEPPKPPFRIRPVEQCARLVVHLLKHRRKEALLPWFIGPLLTIDNMVGGWLGDRWLGRHFQEPDSPSEQE